MISVGRYLAGCGELAAVLAALGFGAFHLRRWAIPSWSGAPARLAEAIIALAIVVWVGELLGALSLFKSLPVIVALLVVPVAAGVLARRRCRPSDPAAQPPSVGSVAVLAAVAACAFIVALWSLHTLRNFDRGMYGFDTLWYHMPFAASFVQSGSLTGLHHIDPLYLNWFYPANSELLHATGALFFDRDILSPLVNMGWLGLALLAAWCVGRPYGAGPLSVIAVVVLLGTHALQAGQPGDAKNDIAGLALLMAATALLVNAGAGLRARGGEESAGWPPGALAVAGLAAGLAAGTKLDMLAAVAAMAAAVVVVAPATRRRAAALAFGAPVLAAGGFWYLRNLVVAGNPLPWVKHLGPVSLPHPSRPIEGREPFTVAHYLFSPDWLFDSNVVTDYFLPGLDRAFGPAWPLLLVLAIAGPVLALSRRADPALRAAGAATGFAIVAYLFTPLSASGPEGDPVGFVLNLRYVAPALAVGLALLAAALPGVAGLRPGRGLPAALPLYGAIAALGALIVVSDKPRAIQDSIYTTGAYALALALVVLPFVLHLLARRGGPARALPALVAAVLALLVIGAGLPHSRDYLRHRYTLTPYSSFNLDRAYQWARDRHGERIGLAGTTIAFFQYGLYGTDMSNRVSYIGEPTAHGGFQPILQCGAWREAVNRGRYDYVVTSPFLNQEDIERPIASPERRWLRTDPGARLVLHDGSTAVFKIARPLDPAGCAKLGAAARISINSLNPPA